MSPYRASLAGRQSGTSGLSDTGSRRASSSVSQVTADLFFFFALSNAILGYRA